MGPHDIDLEMQRILDTHLDDHTRMATALWVQAWADAEAALEAALAADRPTDRIDAALDTIQGHLEKAATAAGSDIAGSADAVTRLGVDGEALMTQAQAPVTVSRADAAQIAAIIDRATAQVLANTAGITPAVMDVIRRRLTGGIALGDNPRETARRIIADTGRDFQGGLARALNISRTEMLDAMRAAQHATDQANRAALRGWVWVAHLDSKTCRSCVAMHGTEHEIDEEGPDDHHSGRCARVPLTKSWADLGIEGVPDVPLDIPDAGEWFDALDEPEQSALLTPRGLNAWKAGNYPLEDWSARRPNTGWRDSIVPSTPPRST